MISKFTLGLTAIAVLAGFTPAASHAQLAEYYIGVDARTAPFAAPAANGGGNYPDNPNLGRLTLLFNHGDHFHAIGNYRYVGAAATPTLEDTSANNRLPETSTGLTLPLKPGTGVYAGANTTRSEFSVEYSRLELRNIQSLDNVDEALLNSSANRWSSLFDDADVHLKLLGVSSPHLKVGSLTDANALPVGADVHLGEGSELFAFTPVLWVDAAAPAGNYSAEFQLIDPNNSAINSGRFFIDVTNVPEPNSVALATVLAASLGVMRQRRLSVGERAR